MITNQLNEVTFTAKDIEYYRNQYDKIRQKSSTDKVADEIFNDKYGFYLADLDVPIDEMNTTSNYAGGEGPQRTPFAFQAKNQRASDKKKQDQNIAATGWEGRWKQTNKWFKKMDEVLNEVSYKQYKTDESMTNKQKINNAIIEINRKLHEIERAVKHASKLKTEVGADQGIFLKGTMTKFHKINERMLRISNYIREMSK